MTIDIGATGTDKLLSSGYTAVVEQNPANASGTITLVRFKASGGADIENISFGIFYQTNGNTLKCRSASQVYAGPYEHGSTYEIDGLDLAVEEGDYIGCHFTAGTLGVSQSDPSGLWYYEGNKVSEGAEATYETSSFDSGVYGEGEGPQSAQPYSFIM
jgi:hypothetical protein